MRKHVIFLLLALSVASMQAQEFQWAKGWTSGDNISGVPSNTIVKSLFDREGNIYILGTFGYGATLDGVELLPMPDPDSLTYSQRQFYMTDVKSTLIAKLSPEGHLLWHKVINPHCRRTTFYQQIRGACLKKILLIISQFTFRVLITMTVFWQNADLCGPHFTGTQLGGIV